MNINTAITKNDYFLKHIVNFHCFWQDEKTFKTVWFLSKIFVYISYIFLVTSIKFNSSTKEEVQSYFLLN